MRRLVVFAVLLLGCEAREAPEAPGVGATPPAPTSLPSSDPADELGAVSLPDVGACVKTCIRRDSMRAEAAEAIAARCREECKSTCEARCAELAGDLSGRCKADCEHQERLAP